MGDGESGHFWNGGGGLQRRGSWEPGKRLATPQRRRLDDWTSYLGSSDYSGANVRKEPATLLNDPDLNRNSPQQSGYRFCRGTVSYLDWYDERSSGTVVSQLVFFIRSPNSIPFSDPARHVRELHGVN